MCPVDETITIEILDLFLMRFSWIKSSVNKLMGFRVSFFPLCTALYSGTLCCEIHLELTVPTTRRPEKKNKKKQKRYKAVDTL